MLTSYDSLKEIALFVLHILKINVSLLPILKILTACK